MKQTNTKTIFWIPVIVLFLIGFLLGIIGFLILGKNLGDSIYSTVQVFMLHHEFIKINSCLGVSRWILLFVFVVAAFQLFIIIVAPRIVSYIQIWIYYKNHIIICGLNKMTINLVEKHKEKQIIVLAEETNKYAESLKAKNVKLLIGDFTDKYFWWKAKLKRTSKLYAIIDNDKMNVKIAEAAFSYLKSKKKESNVLKCFVLINDHELKLILEESALFKNDVDYCKFILFNINEMGTKYGITNNIDKILPAKMLISPEILIVGLTPKTEMALLNLAHCLTMQRETFKFTIEEKDADKIIWFEQRCKKLHLREFAEIEISNNDLEKICTEKTFTSILVCVENQTEAIKQAVETYYLLGENAPNIILFCNDADTFNTVLKDELKREKIFPIILFEEIADYIFALDKHIEDKAKEAHHFWNIIYKMNQEWDAISEPFKQSNRNQILDNYVRTYIAFGEKFDNIKNRLISFSDYDRETLAMIEHRRWMLEKYAENWTYGKRDKENGDPYKRHDCMLHWEELSEEQKPKDYDAIDLMIKLLNNQAR